MKRLILLLPFLALLIPATASGSASYVLQIDMYGAHVVPPVETTAYGFVRFFFNEDRSAADYTLDVKGYSNSAVTGVAIREGAPGENGPVVLSLSDGDFIVTGGQLTLTPEQLETFASGSWYLTLTTVFNPEGEMRGQIVVPANFYTATGGTGYPPPSKPPAQQPVVPVAPPPDAGAPDEGGSSSGGASGSEGAGDAGGGLIRPPNTGDGGLR